MHNVLDQIGKISTFLVKGYLGKILFKNSTFRKVIKKILSQNFEYFLKFLFQDDDICVLCGAFCTGCPGYGKSEDTGEPVDDKGKNPGGWVMKIHPRNLYHRYS